MSEEKPGKGRWVSIDSWMDDQDMTWAKHKGRTRPDTRSTDKHMDEYDALLQAEPDYPTVEWDEPGEGQWGQATPGQ
ncbi:hypothetical protein [Streptomyces sp. CS014]|uniref:hypothetical protein n=1 Tax=Streptomyces sp. CS014 TaxID=2162707 RepID=UPI000D5185AA|nr:hypothetical protein [Streptomyces sp. CS014]PVD04490.1 hypothetical protein DBP12_03430 [Streptomyces sp. CS014]